MSEVAASSRLRTPLPWTGDEGYRKAEVTGGGVSLSEIDPKTMESRKHRGLFLCGEILDAFGPIPANAGGMALGYVLSTYSARKLGLDPVLCD